VRSGYVVHCSADPLTPRPRHVGVAFDARTVRIFFPNASITYPPANGGDVHRYQLVRHLTEMGHRVRSLAPDRNPHAHQKPRNPLSVVHELRRCDVLYCRLEDRPTAATALTGGVFRPLIPKDVHVVWEFNVSLVGPLTQRPRSEREVQSSINRLRKQAKRVDLAICVTDALADESRNLLGIQRTVTIQNGSDPQMFQPDLPRPDDLPEPNGRLRVVSIGSNANAYHDMELVEAACQLIDQKQLPIDVYVFGNSSKLLKERSQSCLHVHGATSYMQIPKYLAAMDVGLTLYNIRADGNSPLKLFDYLASGCVPLCSESQPMRQVLDGTGAGLVRDWTARTLVDELMRLHEDRDALKTMRAAGRPIIEQTYNWRSVATRTVDAIASIASPSKAQSMPAESSATAADAP
jgi:glycosyltransferase involved in cell wall biosynthesis